MRMIFTLAALLLVGLLVTRQLQSPPTATTAVQATSGSQVPSVPTTAQELPQFREDMNSFINKAAEDQAKQIEEATRP